MKKSSTKIEMVEQDPLTELQALIREWREHQAVRHARLASGDEKAVLSTLSADYGLPARAKAAVLRWIDDLVADAVAAHDDAEAYRNRLLAQREPLQKQVEYYLRLLKPIDEDLAQTNEALALRRADLHSIRMTRARVENQPIRTLADLEELLRFVGFDMSSVEAADGNE